MTPDDVEFFRVFIERPDTGTFEADIGYRKSSEGITIALDHCFTFSGFPIKLSKQEIKSAKELMIVCGV